MEWAGIARWCGQWWAVNPNVDAVGSCIGEKGRRIANIIEALNGEKIDIIPYSEEPAKYVAAALGPAKISETEVISEKREVRVFVPPEQLSLAIGKNGQNVRLAAKLTGWKIDIRSALAPEETVQDGIAEAEEQTKTKSDSTKETDSKKRKKKKDEIEN